MALIAVMAAVAAASSVTVAGSPDAAYADGHHLPLVSTAVLDGVVITGGAPDVDNTFGTSVSDLGDLDGDGSAEFVVGAPGGAECACTGEAYIVFTNADGSVKRTAIIGGDTPNVPSLDTNDRFGRSVASLGDLDGDGVTDMAVGAIGHVVGGAGTGDVYVLFLNSDGSVKRTAEINAQTPNGPASLVGGDNFGASVAGLGDIDGDGVTDMAVGAMGHPLGASAGKLYVIFLNSDGSVKRTAEINSQTPNGPSGLAAGDRFGAAVAGLGDIDGDGVADLAAGAPASVITPSGTGSMYVMFLNSDGSVKRTAVIDGDTPNGPSTLAAGDSFGSSVAGLGDLDGDGVTDIAAGAPGHFTDPSVTGQLYVMFLNPDGSIKDTAVIGAQVPNGPSLAAGDYFGISAASLGDRDSDGAPDLIVGTYGDDTLHVMSLNPDGTVKRTVGVGSQLIVSSSAPKLDRFGAAVASLGDLDGDGVADMAVGATGHVVRGAGTGDVYVLFLNSDGSVKRTAEINAQTPNGPSTLASGDRFGASVASLGDLDGDGVTDMAVGSTGHVTGGAGTGDLYVIFLNSDGTVKRTAEINSQTPNGPSGLAAGDRFGAAVASLGDLDGDGVTDIAVGASGHYQSGVDTGDLYVIFLNSDGSVKRTAEINAQTPNGPSALASGDRFGASVAGLGDLDGDGVTDIAAGAPASAITPSGTGSMYVMFLNADGSVKRTAVIDGDTPNGPSTLATGDSFGSSVAGLGDLDGDGVTDMAAGAPGHLTDQSATGQLYVMLMNTDASVKGTMVINGDTANGPSGLAAGDRFGSSVASLGDLDGDGGAEIAIGAPNSASVYMVSASAPANPDMRLVSTFMINGTAITSGAPGGDNTFGRSVANLGDLDGDGTAEFAMGAPGSSVCSCTGEIYITFTNADGAVRSTAVINGDTPNGPASLGAGDRFGRSVASLGDLDGDGVPDMAVGAIGHITGGVATGDVYVMFLNSDGTVKRTAEINAQTPNGPASLAGGDSFGSSVASLGDLDGDGVIEIAAGATGHYQSGVATGDVYVMFMNANGTVKRTTEINGDTPNGPSSLGANDNFGYSLANVGDLDGDGVTDMASGAPGHLLGSDSTGDVHVIFLNSDGTVKRTAQIGGATPNGPSLAANDRFGESVAGMGDLDGDGTADMAVGAPGYFTDPSGTGDLYVLFMNSDGTVKRTAEINAQTPGGPSLMAGDHFGMSVANIGDRSFDGIPDLAVGTYGDDTVHLILLNADGSVGLAREMTAMSIIPSSTVDANHFGWSAANIGDLDGDGTSDMVVGATGRPVGGTDTGHVYVLFLNPDGSVRDAARIDGDTPNGPSLAAGDRFGSSVAGIGDLDGDGVTEIAAGAPGHALGSDSTGYIYVLFLNPDGTVKRTAQIGGDTPNGPSLAANDKFGESVAGIGDLDGDGVTEIAAGAPEHVTGDVGTGDVYVMFMNADASVKRTAEINGDIPNGPSLAAGDRFGRSVAGIGDLDGDGVTEIAAGAPGHVTRGVATGDVYVMFLNSDGTVKRTAQIDGDTPNGPSGLMVNDHFGTSVAGVGDLDGDGSVHVAVGAPGPVVGPAGMGSVYLLSLNSDGSVKDTDVIDSQTPNGPSGLVAGDRFGLSVAGMGDLDGDGGAEIAIGAPNSASVYVAFTAPGLAPPPAAPGTVFGTVYSDTNNNAMMDAGEPGIGGVTVTLVDGAGTVSSAVTGSGGGYSFADAAPGPVLVQAAPLPQMHKPSAGTSSYTYGILPAQGGLAIDFALYPVTPSAAATVAGKVYGDANGNTVFDGADAGLAGVSVFVVDFLTLSQGTALTDASGDYAVSGVLPDSVLVQIAPVPAGFLPQAGQEAYRYLALSEGATAPVDFVLSPVAPQDLASVGGTVYQDNNGNGVRDAGEPGIPDSLVFVFELLTAQQQTAFTDADGEYSFDGVLPDTVLVQHVPKHESITPTAPAGGFAYLDLGAGQSATQDFANSGMLASPVDTLTAEAFSEDRIDLLWDEPATPAGSDPNSITGYRIDVEYPPGTGFEPITLDTFTGLTWFYHTGLEQGIQYNYRVFPITEAGTSSASNVATAVIDPAR